MNGAESLIQTFIDADLTVCFANPGTTEMPMVRALDARPGMRPILCLFEGVATGAADGYARMAEKPGLTLLHLGPGFANGIAYLHDARRSRSPIVNLIGDHATWHVAADAPLQSDIVSLARPVSAWIHSSRSADEMAGDAANAIAAASAYPGRIATLILPHDYQMGEAHGPATAPVIDPPAQASDEAIKKAAIALQAGEPAALFLGGFALRDRGLKAAARIAEATGCRLMGETFPARWERGVGTPAIERLPYFPEPGVAMIGKYKTVILAGSRSPVTFFGYPGLSSYFISPEQTTLTLATPEQDSVAALEALADAVNAPASVRTNEHLRSSGLPEGRITPESFSSVIASLIPENAIIMDESNTSLGPFYGASDSSHPHSVLTQPGGAIGLGPPCATGAAIACPDRVVINLQADGSAMYTIQSLWTQARESLNVKTLICNNRSYRILGVELSRAGVKEFGEQARRLIGLTDPPLDWVSLAKGLGVPGVRVETAEGLGHALKRAIEEPGPQLIDVIL